MAKREPVEVTNLDQYGSEALLWGRAQEALDQSATADVTFFLGTVGADGKPHAAGVGALWHDGDIYVVSGPGTRKSKDLTANPACTLSVRLPGIDLTLAGEAARVTDSATLEAVSALYRESGWPVVVKDGAFTAPFTAPSAGPPPWHLYHVAIRTIVGVASAEPHGATRWRFE